MLHVCVRILVRAYTVHVYVHVHVYVAEHENVKIGRNMNMDCDMTRIRTWSPHGQMSQNPDNPIVTVQ
jgi:hypothetical protein